MVPPHLGHFSGSASKTAFINTAQVIRHFFRYEVSNSSRTVLSAVSAAAFSSVAVCTFGRTHQQHGEHSPALLKVIVT